MVDLDQSWRFIDAEFGDGTYRFGLRWQDVIELQQACGNVGPLVILQRLTGPWQMEDIREVIRLALIGGGMEPVKALRLTKTYVENRPALENLSLAYRVLATFINGPLPPEGETAGSAVTGNGTPQEG